MVVENVERVMAEEGLPPKEATRKSMGQIQGALVGIAMVLSAVFIPMAFFGGSTGAIYRQFSITIVSAMALSVLVALILTPALCATMLKPIQKGSHGATTGFFGWFNRMFDKSTHHYTDQRRQHSAQHRSLSGAVSDHRGGYGMTVRPSTELVPAGRGPGCIPEYGAAACRRHPGAYAESAG
ncbi:RND efflux system [Klebsiella pneumoniae]|uniref:RND efflux system n=1 Tax=Klebsiella pneumoniae TaxID=573 RepID=A0A3S4GRX4_KLEPN|nr:RND efflux system [Klebsiella pneumoniae]